MKKFKDIINLIESESFDGGGFGEVTDEYLEEFVKQKELFKLQNYRFRCHHVSTLNDYLKKITVKNNRYTNLLYILS